MDIMKNENYIKIIQYLKDHPGWNSPSRIGVDVTGDITETFSMGFTEM